LQNFSKIGIIKKAVFFDKFKKEKYKILKNKTFFKEINFS